MNKTEHLLTILVEECTEIGKDACKAIRFGMRDREPGPFDTNKRRMEREISQLLAVSEMLGLKIRDQDKVEKKAKVRKYMAVSRRLGTLV